MQRMSMYNLATKYCFCLDNDPRENQNAFLLLFELETYVNGAIIQIQRPERTRKAIDRKIKRSADNPKPIKKNFQLTRLALDTHFYFICIGQVNKFLKRLCEELDNNNLWGVYSKFRKQFDKSIRDDLEHLDERAVGKKYNKDIGHISDFGNFVGNSFSFNGKQFPADKESLKELKQIYEKIIDVLYKDYGSKDQHFLWMEQSDKLIKEISHNLKNKDYFEYLRHTSHNSG